MAEKQPELGRLDVRPAWITAFAHYSRCADKFGGLHGSPRLRGFEFNLRE